MGSEEFCESQAAKIAVGLGFIYLVRACFLTMDLTFLAN